MGFLRHEEIYRSDEEARSGRGTAPGAHRFDEFPAGYSLAGCSPAEPASASPTGYSMSENGTVGNLFPANSNLSLFSLSHDRGAAQSDPTIGCPMLNRERWTGLALNCQRMNRVWN